MLAQSATCPACKTAFDLKPGGGTGTVVVCPKCGGFVPLAPVPDATNVEHPSSGSPALDTASVANPGSPASAASEETRTVSPGVAASSHPSASGTFPPEARRFLDDVGLSPPPSGGASGTHVGPDGPPRSAEFPFLAPPQQPDELGRLGAYRVLGVLGAGGMGAVFRAEDPVLRRQLALKVMLPHVAHNPTAKARFLREARSQAAVEHDHVIAIHQVGVEGDVPFLAMPLLKGQPLSAALKANPAVPIGEAIRIAREMAAGLAAAHELGLVHRDIKPANVWLEGRTRRVEILDFGLARGESDAGGDEPVTQAGAVIGTPAYMSPEQGRGLAVDARTDLWSLGIVLYQMTTGELPFRGPTTLAILTSLALDNPPPPIAKNPSVPTALSDLVMRLLAKSSADRPASAEAVVEALRVVETSMHRTVEVPVMMYAPAAVAVADPWESIANTEPDAEVAADEPDAIPEATAASDVDHAVGASRSKRKPWLLIGALLAFVAVTVVAADIIIKITNKDGSVSELKVPDGSKVEINGKTVTPDPKRIDPMGPLPATFKNGIGMEFVKVPKGTAWLGGGAGKPGDTKVEFKEDFYLGKYEVTQEEWEAITGLTPSHFSRNGPGKDSVKDISDAELKRFPVEQVSWDDCQVFIKRLNEKEKESGWVYRLPKESEWEYACRCGPVDKLDSAFDFYFAKPTNTLLPVQANFNNVLKRACKVGSYVPNLLGLHDMHGNNHEWCDDAEKAANGAPHRVGRGGRWDRDSGLCRAAYRGTGPPSYQFYNLGLRLARVPSVPVGK